jgi:SHS2 domain-containing protein
VPRGYEFFEHTADIGALVRGATLPRLFENAAAAMFDLICDRRTVRPRRRLRVAVRGGSLEDLLVRFLSELLFRHETEGWLMSSVRVERLDRRRLHARAVAKGEPIDRARHALRSEIKAVTYHQIRIVRGRSAWRVRIVFDI